MKAIHNAKVATMPMVGPPAPITRNDLSALAEAAPGTRNVGHVARLKASHHNVARLHAWGMDNKEVAAHTGYTPERISQLVNAPAMQELIASYRARLEEKQEENIDAYLSLKAQNMIAAERHIADAIAVADEEGELLPIKTALAISADGADRLGYSKRSQVTVNHEFANALDKAIARSKKVIDVTPSAACNEPPQQAQAFLPVTVSPSTPTRNAESEQRPLIKRRA